MQHLPDELAPAPTSKDIKRGSPGHCADGSRLGEVQMALLGPWDLPGFILRPPLIDQAHAGTSQAGSSTREGWQVSDDDQMMLWFHA